MEWYGLGTGLEAFDGWEMLHELAEKWPFFQSVLQNAALALAKADLGIARQYTRLWPDPKGEAIWARIVEEHERPTRVHDGVGRRIRAGDAGGLWIGRGGWWRSGGRGD